jgi:hypothetical protein
MKNLHILPTDKPSRLHLWTDENGSRLELCELEYSHTRNTQHIYITSDEEITGFENNIWVIKGERIFLWQNTMALVSNNKPKKIILTTVPQLIKDGVHAIDDEFLEWFVKNPNCEEVEVQKGFADGSAYGYDFLSYKIIIPQEEPEKTKGLVYWKANAEEDYIKVPISVLRYIAELESRMYSETIEFAEWIRSKDFQTASKNKWIGLDMKYYTTEELFEQFKKNQDE